MSATERDDQTPVLEIEDLNISFFVRAGEIPAVMDFSCKVMPGETMGLVGESGCGKSTVALGIMRDMGNRGKIVGGKIKFKGRDMGEMSEDELRDIRGSKIAMIYQEPMASLNPAMKIGRQLMEVPLIHEDIEEQEAYDRALDMLHKVKLPDPARVMEAYPHQISGGQQQRIVIAMALMSKPDLLLLDEPTTALDVTVEAGIVELVKELGRTTGTSMLFISHNLGLILETCDRITVMYSGEAVETGSVHEVFDRMRHPYTQGLFNSIPLPGADKNAKPLLAIPGQLPLPMARPHGCNFGPRCEHYIEDLCNAHPVKMQAVPGEANHMSRCERIEQIDWEAEAERKVVTDPVEPGRVVLDIRDLKKYYDVAANKIFGGGDTRTVKANETVTFQAREAETVAIVGESGCGKSTLAKVLLGLETATSGSVMLDGKEIANTVVNDRRPNAVASLQMVFQNPFDTLNPSHTVGNQIIRTLEKFDIGEPGADRHERMLKLLDLVKLPRAFADRMPRQLSGGQKQRIGVARAFAGEPKVVVADEPVSALDVSVQAAVTELLMEIQREAKTTMLFISHDLSVVRYIADRVVVMYLGHIVEQGTTDDIFAPPYHPYTEALLSAIPIADTSVEKKHIVLDGDIPSALNPPSGCPFQTRCPRKAQVQAMGNGNLCETTVPPVRDLGAGHQVKCHLSDEDLSTMEPVIVLGGSKATKTRTVVTQGIVKDGETGSTVDDERDAVTPAAVAASAALGGAVLSRGQADAGEASSHLPDGQLSSSEVGMRRVDEATDPLAGDDLGTDADGTPLDRSAGSRAKSDVSDAPAAKAPRKPKPKMPKAKAPAKTAVKKPAAKKATAKAPAKSAAKPAASKTKTAKAPAKAPAKTASRTKAAAQKTTTKATGGSEAKRAALASAASKRATTGKAKTTKAAPARPEGSTVKTKTATAKPKAAAKPTAAKTKANETTGRTTSTGKPNTPARAVAKPKDNAPPRMRKPRKPDDLKMISGVGPKIEGILNGLGIYSFEQISKWKKAERAWVDDHLRFKGRIEREDWVKQAKALAKGGRDEYVRVFGKEPR